MKKIFSFVAAALMSVSMFASLEVAPDDATLNGYKGEGENLVVAIYVDDAIKCGDIVWVGTYNEWSTDVAALATFVPVEGFAGWYVACAADATEDGAIQGKPVHLNGSSFSWDYQVGPDVELVRGTANIVDGNPGEKDIHDISSATPLVLNVKSWKNNPCTVVYEDYKITMIAPDCNEEDYITPAISGGFNDWAQEAMTMDELATAQRQQEGLLGAVFTITAHAAVGSEYKFRSSEEWGKDWTNELKEWDAETEEWKGFNGGANFKFGEETELMYDLSNPDKYTWTNCDKPTANDYEIYLKAPAMCQDITPAIVGSATPGGWDAGTEMTWVSENTWYIKLEGAQGDFKFYDLNLKWDNEIQMLNAETGEWVGTPNLLLGDETTITIDYSDAAVYRWKVCPTDLVEIKATKEVRRAYMMEDGQIYFKANDKVFNVLGAEVK